MKIFTAEQMRAFDREAVEKYGVPSIVLMENAALRVVEFLEGKFAPLREKRVVVLCGKGNNGGDGFAIARHLEGHCASLQVLAVGPEELKGDARINFEILQKGGCHVRTDFLGSWSSTAHYDVVVDALTGTGFSGVVREELVDAFQYLHRASASRMRIVAVDIPSALNADTGEAAPEARRSHFTVTFAAPKRGMFVRDGVGKCGEVWIGDIGSDFSQMDEQSTGCELISHAFAHRARPQRSRDAHKGVAGRVLVIGGSRGMSGAVALAARASLQIGAGLCLAAVPDAILDTVASSVLEATTHPLLCDDRGALTEGAVEDLRERWGEMQAVAIGPGTGRAPSTWELVRAVVRECPVPIIVDADALHALPAIADEVKSRVAPTILTPHPGEMGVLLGTSARQVEADRFVAVEECANTYNAVTVLKGACSLVRVPDALSHTDSASTCTWVNPTGNPGMATGGSGDVLTGAIAGLLAQTRDAQKATLLGVYLHGLAGDIAYRTRGDGLVAGDIAAHLPLALCELETLEVESINPRLRKLM
jgi:hydroxyethylthiazole kinase-like uncharacterized protein yjeF